jgi:hypothetical protein
MSKILLLTKTPRIDPFQAWQRLRTAFEFVASENVKAVFRLHVENKWGEAGHHQWSFQRVESDVIGYDLAYLDLFIPNTDVNLKVGKQLSHPSWKSWITHVMIILLTAVVASTPINDMVGSDTGLGPRLSDLKIHPTSRHYMIIQKMRLDVFCR